MFLILVMAVMPIVDAELIHSTKFFTIPIEPTMFNWTLDIGDEYRYHASLLKSPDLPSWIEYLYSRRHRMGFLYGVPPPNYEDLKIVTLPCRRPYCASPRKVKQARIQIELIGVNKRTYETRRRVIHLTVQEKSNPAVNHVHLKIDNLNVEDLFDNYRIVKLLDIFRHKLWPDSFADLYVTFLTSAVAQGARLPLKPNESEGVVIKLGSTTPFSYKLTELEKEVKPLEKLLPCPRDFKRTTVERWFRDEGFALDWCSFKLLAPLRNESKGSNQPFESISDNSWLKITRADLPLRSYSGEFAVTILVPMVLMVLLVVMLSIVLCFQHEGMDEGIEAFIQSLFVPCEDLSRSKRKHQELECETSQFVAVQRATSTLRSLSRPRDQTPDWFEDDVTRPTPPPYSGTLRSNKGDF